MTLFNCELDKRSSLVNLFCIAMHLLWSPSAAEVAIPVALTDQISLDPFMCITLWDGWPTLSFPLNDPTWHPIGASLETSSLTTWKFVHSNVCLKFSEDMSKCVSELDGQIKREKP